MDEFVRCWNPDCNRRFPLAEAEPMAHNECPACGACWAGHCKQTPCAVPSWFVADTLKVRPGKGICSVTCVRSTANECKCSCKGWAHGTKA